MRIAISADNHLGKALKMKKSLREMAIKNFSMIPDVISKEIEPVDYVIFSGDVFDKDNTDIQSYYAYVHVLRKLVLNPLIKKVLIITGNHDQYNEYFSRAAIDVGELLGSDKIVVCSSESLFYYSPVDNVLFCLLPYHKDLFLTNEVGTKRIIDMINEFIMKIRSSPEFKDSYKILISHFAVHEWMPFGADTVVMNELRAGSHFDLVVLGDLHNETYEDFKEIPPIVYTGSTMHTSITDLYNHKNGFKILDINNGDVSSTFKELYTPPVKIIDKDGYQEYLKVISSDDIIVTSDLDIHNAIKDRVLYSSFKPSVKDRTIIDDMLSDDSIDETVDIKEVARSKINGDETLTDEDKAFLMFLLNIDTTSMAKKDISDMVYNYVMQGL